MPEKIIIESWEDADQEMKALALAQARIDAINAELAEKETALKEAYQERLAPLFEEYKAGEEVVKAFASAHRADLGKQKSWQGNFGEIKFRKNPDTFELTRPDEAVIAALEGYGHPEAVKVEKKLIKAELAKLPRKELLQAGIVHRPGIETVKVEPDLEALKAVEN